MKLDKEVEHEKDVSEAMILADDRKKGNDGEEVYHEKLKQKDVGEGTFPFDEIKK